MEGSQDAQLLATEIYMFTGWSGVMIDTDVNNDNGLTSNVAKQGSGANGEPCLQPECALGFI